MPNFLTEKNYIPPEAKELGAERVFVYTGRSMSPTFRPGHLLYVRPAAHDLAAGDVVVYFDAAQGGHVVHRVVAATQEGLVTRGDHNPQRDARSVAYGQVVGRVSSAELGGSVKHVAGGRGGLWAARARWAALALWPRLCVFLGAPYRALRASPRARHALTWIFRPRFQMIRLQTPQGLLVKVLHRGRVVARTHAGGGRLVCRKPYDLFIAESDLLVNLNGTRSRDE
jgi:signal peptidase I